MRDPLTAPRPRALVSCAAMALTLCLSGCSSKGKAGTTCQKPHDCAHMHYCLEGVCKAGPETACAYLKRCLPLVPRDQSEVLFGQGTYFQDMLNNNPSEKLCDNQLKVIQSVNRTVILQRACGPMATQAP